MAKTVNFFIDLTNTLKGSGIYSSAIRLKKGLIENNYSVVINNKNFFPIIHVHTALPMSYIKLNRILARRKKNKNNKKLPIIIMHGHTTIEDFVNSFFLSNQLKPLLKWYLPRFYKKTDHLIAVSNHNKEILKKYGIPEEKISVISNGINLNVKHINLSIRMQARKLIGLNEKDILIIGLGICIYRKGIDRFIDIAQKLPNHQFIWIGKRIPTPFLAHATYIKKKFQKAPKNCKFPGYVSYKTLVGLFSASDIFLYPTREENQGIAFLEAIMHDKPAIISDHPVFEEYKENFHVLKASTIDEFVEKIEILSTDHKLRRKLIENSKSYLKVHDIKKSVKAISDLYTSKLE